jgi:hypothetical protein
MPTRGRPDPPPIEVRRFTPEEAAWAINLLESRVADVKALETLRYDDPKVEVALDKIRGNIVEIFRENSREYREHRFYNISGGDSIAVMGFGDDSSYHEAQCQRDFLNGIPRTITMLGGLIDTVRERTNKAQAAVGAPAPAQESAVPIVDKARQTGAGFRRLPSAGTPSRPAPPPGRLAGETSEPSYDVAEVCSNGHVTNTAAKARPQHSQKYCQKCGAATITRCPKCSGDIRGEYRGAVPSLMVGDGSFPAPPFCVHCGDPFPWTKGKLEAARELAMEQDGLTPEEQEQLAKSLDDLVRDTPRTAVAATRFKKLVSKAGAGAAGGFKDILVSVVVEAAKKIIWP